MRILAIDYGEKRFGLAISDPLGITAQPFGVIEKDSRIFENISEIIKKNDVDKVIVGMPINMSGTYGKSAEKVIEFTSILKNSINIPVENVDERLSTWEANKRMSEFKLSIKNKKKNVDKFAATIILETYLSSHPSL